MKYASPLLTKEDIQSNKNLPHWFQKEYKTFHQTVTEPSFPCFFGMNAEKRGELRYTHIDQMDWSALPIVLEDFVRLLNGLSSIRHHSLIVFVEPETQARTLEYYWGRFWDILQYLHHYDPQPWPAGEARDPDHHLWNFHFLKEPMFVFGNAPAYKQRQSRNLGDSLILGFQPRQIFKGLEGTKPEGAKAREKVRKRVKVWDRLPKHPDISHFGDPAHQEWKQFFIGDNAKPAEGKCPFHYEK